MNTLPIHIHNIYDHSYMMMKMTFIQTRRKGIRLTYLHITFINTYMMNAQRGAYCRKVTLKGEIQITRLNKKCPQDRRHLCDYVCVCI